MADTGVHVSIIEPGNYDTDIGKNVLARMQNKGYDKEDSPSYKAYYERISGWVNEEASAADQGGDPQQVAQAALQTMFSENPKRRYLVKMLDEALSANP